MNYFVAKDLVNGVEDLFYTNRPIVKGDYVVIPNYNDEPITAVVTNIVSRFKALKMNREPEEIIAVVDMKSFNAKREKELDNVILVDKMEKEIKRIQLMEKLEKYAGKDPKMLELFNSLNGNADTDNEMEYE